MKYLDGYPELDLLARALSFSSPSLRVSTRIEAYSCKAIKSEKRLFKHLEKDLVSDIHLSTSISPPEHYSTLVESVFGPLDQKEPRKILYYLIATLNLAFPDHDFSSLLPEEFNKEESARVVLSSLSSALNHLRSNNFSTGGPGADSTSSFYKSFSSYPPSSASTLPGYRASASASSSSKRTGAGAGASSSSMAMSRSRSNERKNLTSSALHNKLRDLQNGAFGTLAGEDYEIPTHPLLRTILDPIIDLNDCEVYSYTPDLDSDPHAYMSEEEEEDEDDYTSPDEDMMDMEFYVDSSRVHSSSIYGRSDAQDDSVPSTPVSGTPKSSKRPSGLHRRASTFSRRGGTPRGISKRGGPQQHVDLAHRQDQTNFMMDEDLFGYEDGENAIGGMDTPVSSSGDETGGLLWSSNYFFYNKKKKRILFISCWGRKLGHAGSSIPPVHYFPTASSKRQSSAPSGRLPFGSHTSIRDKIPTVDWKHVQLGSKRSSSASVDSGKEGMNSGAGNHDNNNNNNNNNSSSLLTRFGVAPSRETAATVFGSAPAAFSSLSSRKGPSIFSANTATMATASPSIPPSNVAVSEVTSGDLTTSTDTPAVEREATTSNDPSPFADLNNMQTPSTDSQTRDPRLGKQFTKRRASSTGASKTGKRRRNPPRRGF